MKKGVYILWVLSALLMFLGIGSLFYMKDQKEEAQEENRVIAEQIEMLLPERTEGSVLDYSDVEMPVLQIHGKDYVSLLEIPSLGVVLPVRNQWEDNLLVTQPAKYWGSIYDGSMILGGSNQEGQFDFCSKLDLGDRICVIDMQGTEFSLCVERIDRSSSVEFEKLYDQNYPLTLFVKGIYDQKYIIVRCAGNISN